MLQSCIFWSSWVRLILAGELTIQKPFGIYLESNFWIYSELIKNLFGAIESLRWRTSRIFNFMNFGRIAMTKINIWRNSKEAINHREDERTAWSSNDELVSIDFIRSLYSSIVSIDCIHRLYPPIVCVDCILSESTHQCDRFDHRSIHWTLLS